MTEATFSLEAIEKPSKWPSANARLLGLGAGLPVNPLDRLANSSADDFENGLMDICGQSCKVSMTFNNVAAPATRVGT